MKGVKYADLFAWQGSEADLQDYARVLAFIRQRDQDREILRRLSGGRRPSVFRWSIQQDPTSWDPVVKPDGS